MALAMLTEAGAQAAGNGAAHLTVYLREHAYVPADTRFAAQMQAAKMFADIGLKIDWRCCRAPRAADGQAILITFETETPDNQLPAALAYALPYEGIHINVFYARIVKMVPASGRSTLLAHVLVHEITHVIQGVVRHSREGVMKAAWSAEDYQNMLWKSLPFAREDIDLIVRGLNAHAAARGAGPAVARNVSMSRP
jgi:hypothetical protein